MLKLEGKNLTDGTKQNLIKFVSKSGIQGLKIIAQTLSSYDINYEVFPEVWDKIAHHLSSIDTERDIDFFK